MAGRRGRNRDQGQQVSGQVGMGGVVFLVVWMSFCPETSTNSGVVCRTDPANVRRFVGMPIGFQIGIWIVPVFPNRRSISNMEPDPGLNSCHDPNPDSDLGPNLSSLSPSHPTASLEIPPEGIDTRESTPGVGLRR